jgi:mediator of RNA polymerase II transcription subunit 12
VDLDTFPYFGPPSTDVPAFADKLCTLLTWAVTPLQHGDHRPFAAVTLLRLWHGKAEERAIRHDLPPPNEHIQDQVFDWLDSSEVTTDPANVRAIAILLGLLVQHDLLCYASYIQRLIARGEPGLSFVDVRPGVLIGFHGH